MKYQIYMEKNVQEAIEHLQKGHVILYPTDTIWGLGCDPRNQQAVDRIFEIKKRPKDKPLILLVDCIERLRPLVTKIHPHLENILYYNQRPLTIVFPKSRVKWSEGITGENGSVAIRIVRNEFCRKVIQGMDSPIVSSSANLSGAPFPKSFGDIDCSIKESVDYIVDCDAPINPEDALPSLVARYSAKQKELVFLRS